MLIAEVYLYKVHLYLVYLYLVYYFLQEMLVSQGKNPPISL